MIHPKDHHKCFARLACVKHAASVHPEPGSNSLKKFVQDQNLAWLIFYPVLFTLVLFFKNYILLNFQGYVTVQLSRFLSFLSLFRQLLDDITEVRICQELFLSFLNQFSVKRRRRDLNPCAAINDLLPFQGSPFGQLGYFSKSPYLLKVVLYQIIYRKFVR